MASTACHPRPLLRPLPDPSGIVPDEAVALIRELLDSLGDTCPPVRPSLGVQCRTSAGYRLAVQTPPDVERRLLTQDAAQAANRSRKTPWS
jgi:hypothetical protein